MPPRARAVLPDRVAPAHKLLHTLILLAHHLAPQTHAPVHTRRCLISGPAHVSSSGLSSSLSGLALEPGRSLNAEVVRRHARSTPHRSAKPNQRVPTDYQTVFTFAVFAVLEQARRACRP